MRQASSAAAGLALIVAAATCMWGDSARARPGDPKALASRVSKLYLAGKYREAMPLARRYAEAMKLRYGIDRPQFATALNNLALLYRAQGHYAAAESLYKRALAIAKRLLGPDHPDVGTKLNNLAVLYQVQGRYSEAEPLFKRSLAIVRKAHGPDHPDVGRGLNNLAELYRAEGHYAKAEPLYRRALAITENALGPDHSDVGTWLTNLAGLYQAQGRYAEAEGLYRRALAIAEKAPVPSAPDVSLRLNGLAVLYDAQGRYAEAEPLYKRALEMDEKALGPDHPNVGRDLNNLAGLYQAQGRYAETEPLYRRALAIDESALGVRHSDVGRDLNNLAELYRVQGRYAEAEPLEMRALSISEKALGPDHPLVGTALNNLAALYQAQGRFAEAEPLYRRSLSIGENSLGPDHPAIATALNNLGALYQAQGRYAEAEALYGKAVAIDEKSLGPDHPDVGTWLNNLATLHFSQGEWSAAAGFWRRSAEVVMRRTQRGTLDATQSLTGDRRSEAEQSIWKFKNLVKAAYRAAPNGHDSEAAVGREMFQIAQWAQNSEAAASLAQMAVRGAKGDLRLATLVRERQDLVAEWQKRDIGRSAAVAQAPDKRDLRAEAANVTRLAEIDTRIADIDKRLAVDFPDYAVLVSPAPMSVEDVQANLGHDEALVLFLDTQDWKPAPEETFIWIVTKTDNRWIRVSLGTGALREEVAALRCGLDYDGTWSRQCNDLLKVRYTAEDYIGGKPLPFDLNRSYSLYTALFGAIEDLIDGKQLLIVASGPLTQLPFQVLVTEAPKSEIPSSSSNYRKVAWLVRKHALTILPAVSSLKALREFAKQGLASEPYVGFGNPLLEGDPAVFKDDGDKAKLAREKHCVITEAQGPAVSVLRGGSRPMTLGNNGLADVDLIRRQVPLPETADELCNVAHDLGVDPATHLYLGESATEAKIKRLSNDGTLAKYKIVHFATHGALAGQLSPGSEPGLILTPPSRATEFDDGYLTASEITSLRLDADWVILSACNTAAGSVVGAEALSGLARAFFYAGARSLLVSHWEVSSDSTVKLITKAIAELAADPKIGRAEALRRSMLAMIDDGKSFETYPAFWAPFSLVGEGAR